MGVRNIPTDEWGGLLGFHELGWHIKQAIRIVMVNFAIEVLSRKEQES